MKSSECVHTTAKEFCHTRRVCSVWSRPISERDQTIYHHTSTPGNMFWEKLSQIFVAFLQMRGLLFVSSFGVWLAKPHADRRTVLEWENEQSPSPEFYLLPLVYLPLWRAAALLRFAAAHPIHSTIQLKLTVKVPLRKFVSINWAYVSESSFHRSFLNGWECLSEPES